MKKTILWATANGIALALIAISLLGSSSPLPSPSELDGVADRIHVMSHQLDELEHLYSQSLGCRSFISSRTRLMPIPQEAK